MGRLDQSRAVAGRNLANGRPCTLVSLSVLGAMLLTAGAILAGSASARAADGGLTAQERQAGFRPVFNGVDLTGWEGAGKPANACWLVEGGMLVCDGKSGPWLRSRQRYDDFNFRFDYRLEPGGNSGVYVRVPANGNHHRHKPEEPEAGFEIQLLDDQDERYAALKDYQYTGSVYAISPATMRVCKPAGEWNTMEIDCLKGDVTVVHNGHLVVSAAAADLPSLALRCERGFLGLQNHSSRVWFRNLRIGPAVGPPASATAVEKADANSQPPSKD